MTRILSLSAAILPVVLVAQAVPVPQPSAVQWREDLRTFADELPRVHRNAFHSVTQDAFSDAVAKFDAEIPSLADYQIAIGFMRLAAMIGDGHTLVGGAGRYFRAGRFPILMHTYRDGLFIRRAAAAQAAWLGARVVRVGEVSAEEALSRVAAIVSRDNDMGLREDGPRMLSIPEVLVTLGISPSLASLSLTLEQHGVEHRVSFDAVARPPADMVDARSASTAPLPLYLKDPGNWYWFEYLQDSRVLYVQFNQVRDKPEESIEAFFARVVAEAAARPVDRLVIDLRANGGGNNVLNASILRAVIRAGFDQPGRLFVLIGRGTFSAAQNLVNLLDRFTDAIFVGEPTGSRPNSYGDARAVPLPHSGLILRASTLWHQDMHPRDTRPFTAPDVPAEWSAADYQSNRDPALEAVLAWRPSGSSVR